VVLPVPAPEPVRVPGVRGRIGSGRQSWSLLAPYLFKSDGRTATQAGPRGSRRVSDRPIFTMPTARCRPSWTQLPAINGRHRVFSEARSTEPAPHRPNQKPRRA